jgi:hypothetical protein
MRTITLAVLLLWCGVAAGENHTACGGTLEIRNNTTARVDGFNGAAFHGQINAGTGSAVPPNEWVMIDVSRFVPEDATCILLVGRLTMSMGYAKQTCTTYIGFRKHGNFQPNGRVAMTTANTGQGARENWNLWVPLTTLPDGAKVFDLLWEAFNIGSFPNTWYAPNRRYPDYCSMGLAGWVNGWTR